jgi:hypothetical protein
MGIGYSTPKHHRAARLTERQQIAHFIGNAMPADAQRNEDVVDPSRRLFCGILHRVFTTGVFASGIDAPS